ncbi:succinate dehydrogenase/fumarate reductase iron-sulfur subunit [uncultured Adlercreutzia sp.]|uniref:succinate dehydrogenase/fumarate reductase iron-sulfur subunit n=1 Tax=uncultured Adlercreutzia sp. TaxID=875803 RepID=UPI0026744003|nr:2Fe-2S iron-sulfur cluster-binding protein [uncultured Adlercreutzia sp.]
MAKVKVLRFDPSVDGEPYYSDFEVPATEGMSILQGLHYIREHFEPISYEYSCRATSCGMCGMSVNGTPVFACCTPLEDDEEYTIEPLDRYPVIKDLVVDRSAVERRIHHVMPQFARASEMTMPAPVSEDSYMSVSMLQQCRDCGICMSVCPVVEVAGTDEYSGPEVMVKIAARYFDDREGLSAMRLGQAVGEGLFKCLECGTCTSVCPKGELIKVQDFPYSFIDHVRHFQQMKEDARAAGLEPIEPEEPKPLDDYFCI